MLHGEDSVHFLCVVQAASIVSAAVFRSPLILKRDLEMLCGYDDRQLHQPYGTHTDDLKKKVHGPYKTSRVYSKMFYGTTS